MAKKGWVNFVNLDTYAKKEWINFVYVQIYVFQTFFIFIESKPAKNRDWNIIFSFIPIRCLPSDSFNLLVNDGPISIPSFLR